MKKKSLFVLFIIASSFAKAEVVSTTYNDGIYLSSTNSLSLIANYIYLYLRGYGQPFIGDVPQNAEFYNLTAEDMLSINRELAEQEYDQRYNIYTRFNRLYSLPDSLFIYDTVLPNGDYLEMINYSDWKAAYEIYQRNGIYTNTLSLFDMRDNLQSLYSALGGLDNPIETPIVQYRIPEWCGESWTNYPYSFYGVGNDNATAKQLWADTRYQAQVGNNLDSLYNWGMPLQDLLDTLSNPVSGEQMEDVIPARLLDAAGKSMKFHVSMKAKTNALHAVLGFKGSNTLEKAIEEVNANLRGIAANIGQAGGGGESGGGTNEFCCYFGLAWSNFQARSGIVLPEGVSSWDEYLQGWQQDMTQITQSGDDRLRQWWGMMYTQTLLMDRMRRETFGLGGQIARAESLSNSVDRIREDIDDAIRDSDGWKEQVEFDMARMFVSNVAPRVLEPMENFAIGLRGNGQNRKGLFKGANNEVVLLEWTGLGVRIAFDKSQLEDVADTIRSAIRAFLYVVDMLLILWVGVTAFKLCGRAYQWAHSCQ